MTAMELAERLLDDEALAGACLTTIQEAAWRLVRFLLEEAPLAQALVHEASVHLPTRSRIWVASFTGAGGGQVWRSTGLADRRQALILARKWESEARTARAKMGRAIRKPSLRVRPSEPGTGVGPLSQAEIGVLLRISERAVRLAERRALQKLFNHPALREVWRKYRIGELDEDQQNLSPEEVEALFSLAHTTEERHLMEKVLRMIQA